MKSKSEKCSFDLELLMMPFEQFALLIDPILSNDTADLSSAVLRWSFDSLFDQNTNGNVEKEEFESLFILLRGWVENKKYLSDENLRQLYPSRLNHISFQGRRSIRLITRCGRAKRTFV